MNLVVNMAKLEQAGFGDIIEKSFGHRDLSKLTKKQITDKNGHKRNVYVRNGEEINNNHGGTTEESNTSKDGHFTVGDVVSFMSHGEEKQGKCVAGKGDTIIIDGIGESSGIRYTVKVSDVKEKTQNADGTIPASSFNASDYKNRFADPKMTNNAEGVQHLYSLLDNVKDRNGKMLNGREIQAMVEKKLNEQTHRMKYGDTRIRNMHDIKYDENGKFKSGIYNDDRVAMHDEVISKIFTPEVIAACKPKNGEKPKFVMFGGRGGSGKSWFTDKERAKAEGREVMFNGIKAAGKRDKQTGEFIFEKQDFDKNASNFLILDADEIKNTIPEFQMWNAGEVHEESSDLMKRIKTIAMAMGLNVIVDGTMAYNSKKPDKVKNEMLAAKDMGYSTEAHYIFSPIQKSCINAMTRFRTKNGDYSGRLVPTDILLAMQDNEKSFDSVKDIVDDWSFRDNQNFEAKLISKKGI